MTDSKHHAKPAYDELSLWCRTGGLPEPIREFRFAPPRRWRFDYAWPEMNLALEIEGGAWTGGRHTRGAGFVKDIDKYNAATIKGWRLLRSTPSALMTPRTLALVKLLLSSYREA